MYSGKITRGTPIQWGWLTQALQYLQGKKKKSQHLKIMSNIKCYINLSNCSECIRSRDNIDDFKSGTNELMKKDTGGTVSARQEGERTIPQSQSENISQRGAEPWHRVIQDAPCRMPGNHSDLLSIVQHCLDKGRICLHRRCHQRCQQRPIPYCRGIRDRDSRFLYSLKANSPQTVNPSVTSIAKTTLYVYLDICWAQATSSALD